MKRVNLFIKLYLSFLLTTIVIVFAIVYLDRLTGSGPWLRHWQQTVDKTISFYGSEAVLIHDRDGVSALRGFFARLEQATGIRAFLFDAAGNEISGREIDGKTRKLITSAVSRPGAGTLHSDRFNITAERIRSERGAFTFVSVRPSPFPGGPVPPHLTEPGHPPGSARRPDPGMHAAGHPPGPPPGFSPLAMYARVLIALVLSGIGCFLLARYISRPILTLGHAAQQLAVGNLSMRVSHALAGRKDELSALAADFDIMAERIESLLMSQRNLLRDVSHELRSPLARLNVSLELCRQRFGKEGEDLINRIESEVRKLDQLIGQILMLNRIGMTPVKTGETPVDLDELLEEVVADANYEAGSERAAILESRPCAISGDRELLRRVFENTIRNALSHTPADTAVDISLRCVAAKEDGGKGTAVITVRDHGQGVPASELSLIFRPFYRATGSGVLSAGTGLGLAIAEAAIRQHGGCITARNATDGGLVIEMTLPGA